MDGGGREKDKREDGVLSVLVGSPGIRFAAGGAKFEPDQQRRSLCRFEANTTVKKAG